MCRHPNAIEEPREYWKRVFQTHCDNSNMLTYFLSELCYVAGLLDLKFSERSKFASFGLRMLTARKSFVWEDNNVPVNTH